MSAKRLVLSFAALTALAATPALARPGTALSDYKWKARPVVVLSDSLDDPRVAKQISALDHAGPALRDRNITVLRDTTPGSRLRHDLGVSEHGFSVVLVGKDGGVKKVWRDPVDPKAIFTIIDTMPMRRQEMNG